MGNLRKEITKEETSILQKIKEDEMPKYLIDRNKKIISFIALLSVILCSFLGIEYDRLSGNMTDNSISQESYASSFTDMGEVVDAQEISPSTNQFALIRQLSSRRNGAGVFFVFGLSNLKLVVLYFSVLWYMNQHSNSASCSHRVIMCYIHNKDGKKQSYFC